MIQNPSKEVTLIVYDTPKPPKYYKLNKGFVKILFIVIPLMIISTISFSLIYSIFLKNKVNALLSSEPQRIVQLKEVIKTQKVEIEDLGKTNSSMTAKLSKAGDGQTSVSALGLFNVPVGIEDMRPQELIKIEDIKVSSEKEITLSFNLSNNSPDGKKLSGYLSLVQYQGNQIQFYPDVELSQKTLRLDFSGGESFGFTRFRTTKANFKKTSSKSATYKLYIFSKTGDLLTYKQIGPYNIK